MTDSTVRTVIGPTIALANGHYFDFLDPQNSVFGIEDIALGLSNICRFTGQVRRFYSVAEHSVLMSRQVPHEHALAALLHDAAEFVMGDVSKPLKNLLPDYCEIEKQIEAVVLGRFGLSLPLDSCIREADMRMLATEQIQLMGNRDDWDYTRGRKPYDIHLPCWAPGCAQEHFISRFRMLTRT